MNRGLLYKTHADLAMPYYRLIWVRLQELHYKVPPMIQSGGGILALDHRIPNGTPLENYRYYVKRMWELLDSCPR